MQLLVKSCLYNWFFRIILDIVWHYSCYYYYMF